MPKKFNGETLILTDSSSGMPMESFEKGFLFVFHDGKIEKYRLDGVKRLGRMTDGNIPDIVVRNKFSIFVSMGICRIPRISGGNLLTETVEKADKALYQAKRNENEQVCFYEQR